MRLTVSAYLFRQCLVAAIAVVLVAALMGMREAVSAALGATVVLLSSWWFATRYFARAGSRAAPHIVRTMVRSSYLRMGIIAAMLILAPKWPWVDIQGLLLGMLSALMAPLLVGLLAFKNSNFRGH